MGLVIQESLTLEEVLSSLESRLLLHCLEWVIGLLIFIIVLVLVLQIRTWHFSNSCIVGVIISWRTSVPKGNAVNISSQKVWVRILGTVTAPRGTWHLLFGLGISSHGALVPNWWRWVSMNAYSLGTLTGTTLVVNDALVLKFVHQTFHLVAF